MRVLLWPLRLIGFAVWFFGQVIRSNTRDTYDILTAHDVSSPLVLRMRTNCRTEVEVALLATLISLTPGTLVLAMNRDPSDGTRTLFVHALYDERAQVLASLSELETRMLRAIRVKAGSA